MDGGEKNSDLKKRLKSVEIGFDSDDDEPIGSLFKLKKTKNPKKVKSMSDSEKGQKVEIREEKLVVEDEDLAVMDDTLASFRKKLKGPKKETRSGILKGRSSSLSGSFEDVGILDEKFASNTVEKVQDIGEDAYDVATGKGVETKCKGRVKRPKTDSKIKMVGAHFSRDNDSKGMGSLGDSLEDRKEQELWPGEGSNLSLDEKMADSLSAPFQRTQSGLIRKSHMNSGLKNNGRDRNFDEGCSPSFDGDLKPVRRSQSVSTTKVRQKILNFNDNSHLVSDLSKLELTSQQCKKIEPMADTSGLNIQEEAILNTCTNNVCDISGNENVCVHGVDGSGFSQRASSGTQSLKVGLKLCSMDKASTLPPDDQEMPICASSLEQMEEFYKCEGEYKRVFSDALRQHSRNASAIDNSSSDRKVSSSIGKEVSVACVDDELTDKSCKSKSLKVSKTGSDSNTALGEAGLAAISSKGEHDLVSNGRLSLTTEMSCGHRESGFAFQKRSSGFYPDQPSDASKGPCVPGHDPLSIGEEANRDSPSSVTLDENGSSPEDAVSIPDSENKDNKLSAVQRAARIAKKRRHGDMAYEGDADWENLINEQGFLENHQVVDCHRSLRGRDKFDSSSNILTVAENGGAAAVSAGLKARAAGPIEKIKFKEVLKRRGGLQEYLECRNQILSLWSRDVSRILPLTECGVTDTPSEDEPSRASLIREIYTFLDQSGYINVGIASKKEKANHIAKHGYKLFKEEKLEGSSGASVADSEDGVAFILGQVKHSETSVEAKNGDISDDGNQMVKVKKGSLVSPELPNVTEHKVCPIVECLQNGSTDAPDILVNVNVLRADPSSKMVDGGKDPILIEVTNDSQSVKSGCHDVTWGSQHVQCDSEIRKKIIIIGAGPAGLTAARHLQRQGFSVILLEARNRIGGRVYTDHTSLSVPVDLGASIITGVEADVATERRPDPSSLICAQLGLELTVLNSDCPLYDIISGQKVPSDLDEALEAEYNSLLDDMVLLVAQKGEHAMKMSLEEGLEYALKRRRMARLGRDFEDIYLHNSMDAYSKASGVDSRVHGGNCFEEDALSPLERRVMNWHFANLEYGCAALLKEVSLPFWNQDDVYGGFGGAHCMIKGGYSAVVESLADELLIHFNHVVTDISYGSKDSKVSDGQSKVKVATANGSEFWGDAVLITVPLGCLKAESIKFFPPLPQWKSLAIQRLGFGVLNKVVLEFSEVFWDDSVDYFGATAEETDLRGWCFMFWNVRKTVGAPVLIALVVGKAAIDGQNMSSSDHVNHAVQALQKIFGEASVPDPVASVVTDWGRDPFSYGAYSYVAVGASGEDYDILGRPVENSLFFAGEATCKEHPDTVGGAMLSGLREAVRIIDILTTGNDYTAEVEAMEAALRQSESEGDEVMDIVRRLKAVEHSNVFYKNSFAQALIQTRESLLEDMFFKAKTTAGRLHLAKELLNLPVSVLKSFAGTKEGLTMLNSWILDSMGKDGTQLLRHCVRLLVLVSTDLHAVRLSGIGKTVKEKVCVHTSRDIRAIASQLVNVWLEVFRKGKNSSVGVKFSRQSNAVDPFKRKSLKDPASGKPPLHSNHSGLENKGSAGSHLISGANMRRENGRLDTEVEDRNFAMSEEEQAAFAAAEAARAAAEAAARAAAEAAAKAFASSGPQLPKIPSFHKFARRDQYGQMDEFDLRRKWSGGVLGRQDCISEIDSRNCRVRDWSVDFSTACVNFDNSKTADNLSQRSHSNEIACQLNLREHSGESAAAADSSIFTKAWVDTAGSVGIKDYHAIERWQSQAAAADSDFFHPAMHVKDEEESNTSSKPRTWKHDRQANGSSVSQVTINNESLENRPRGADHIKQAVVDYVASLLMPLYKARKIDRDGYKTIMKKSATKVMEQATDAEKNMAVSEFLDSKRKNKIRSFVDKLIERHMTMKPTVKS